jgi:ribosomal protein L21E
MSERKMHDLKSGETVQVTRDELYRIIDEAQKAGYADGRQMAFYYDPTVRERTCHMVWIGRVGDVNQWRCDACGCRSAERIVSDRLHDPAPAWCHRCGSRVVDE